MKKIFTLATLLVLALTVNAQETYRKSWDFTKWSAATIANLKADANWTIDEKGNGSKTEFITDKQCVWEATATASDDGYAVANGVVIDELKGMTYLKPAAKGLAIVSGYIDWVTRDGTNFGPYVGDQFLWLCSKNQNYFIIPHVEPGTTVKMGIETHKYTSSRGVTLYMGNDNTGTALADPVDSEGNAISGGNTAGYADMTWTVPADAAATNDDGTVNLCVRCNNGGGMHIYYITVGDGDSPQVEEAKKVAYLHASGINMEEYTDLAYMMLYGNEKLDLTTIAATEDVTLESLADFDAVLISPSITKVKEANVVKPLIGFIPVINLNAGIYESLGLGKAVNTNLKDLTIVDPTNAIFEGIDAIEFEEGITAVELGDYFKNDAVLAKAGDNVAIHVHNPGRNAYYYIPNDMNTLYDLIPQVIVAAAKTKRAIAAVGTPVITFTQEDGQSVVTITAANSNAIYYTLDGTEPTAASTLYTEPFTLTDSLVVKAFATGDGYTDSEIAEKKIAIAHKAAKPIVSLDRQEGKTIVTLTGTTEGADIYYNFAGQTATTASVLYTEPFEVTVPATLTVFANAAVGFLASDAVNQFVGVNGFDNTNIRWDVLAHFDANKDGWAGKGQQKDDSGNIINANYFFTWGKNAGKYYDETSPKEVLKDINGEDSIVYNTLDPETFEADGWKLTSAGQVMTWESLNIGWNIGDTSMRNPDTAEDAIGVNDSIGITPNALTFGKQPSDGPFNANLQTTTKFAGPFDVVIYAGNGNEGQIPTMQIETSVDGENWVKLGDVAFSLIKRNWKKTQLSYNEEAEVYVRILHTAAKSGAQIYDIYLMNNGELSKAYNEETLGVQTVQPEGAVVRTEIFTLGGSRTANAGRGMQIIRKTYANGSVVTKKVLR